MLKFFLSAILIIPAFALHCFSQDTLPRISVKNINNQIIISWRNNYGAKINNINIQRSKDSLKNFATIGSVLNPLNKENGYVDQKAPGTDMFYRVFVAFDGGTYFFSKAHKPVIEVPEMRAASNTGDSLNQQATELTPPTDLATTPITSSNQTEQELLNADRDLLPPYKKPQKPKPPTGFVPSKFIYANRENNLIVTLPDADKEKFSLHFFDDKDRLVFEIKNINETYIIVEKVNFLHTGWFYYELYDDDVLLEKYKFYIGRDGWTGPPPPETKRPVMTAPQY